MANIVQGSTATITVLITDNSTEFNVPNGTPQPVAVDVATISLFTPSGQNPVASAAMNPGSQIGYYTFSYQSSPFDEVGEWHADFFAQSGSTVAYTPLVPIFRMVSAT